MFDFAQRRAVCLDGMKEAYRVGLFGDSAAVLDGRWRGLFGGVGEGGGGAGEMSEAKTARAHKRGASQSTLDGAFGKKRAKE
jgi:cryptochrome